MAEYAPAAITAAWEQIHDAIPTAQLSGIQGDAAHTYGYHRGRNYCTDPGDYSVQLADDKKGDGDACSALDVTMDDADMAAVTGRLIDATLAGHPGLTGLREFIGTEDGQTVIGMDVRGRYYITSDDTHLWHEHFSGIRLYADDAAAWSDIAAIATGAESEADVWKQIRLVASPAHPVEIREAGVWVPLSWDSWSPEDGSGGTSCVLPPAARLFNCTVDWYIDALPDGENAYVRIQTLDRSGVQRALFKVADLPRTRGELNLSYTRVGSVPDTTNLRVLVAATVPCLVRQAEWRVLYQ